MQGKQRAWQKTPEQRMLQADRAMRRSGYKIYRGRTHPEHQGRFSKRLDKVRDPKTAFFWLMDNVMSDNGGKLLSTMRSGGEYYWVERNREADQAYYIVRKRGNYVTVTRRRWVVAGQGVNTFIGGLVGFDKEPRMVEEVILRHPIMQVTTFKAAYEAVAPDLEFFHFDD